jgi:hypothetical protein
MNDLARTILKHQDFLAGRERWLLGIKVRALQNNIYPFEESLANPAKAMEERLLALKPTLELDSDFIPSITHTRMVWTLPSMFGCKMTLVNDEPWAEPFITDIRQAPDLAEPASDAGGMPQVLEALDYFGKNAPAGMPITPPSEHTPLNIAYMLRGGALYTDLYDHPAETKQLLQTITNTFIKVEHGYKRVLGEKARHRITFAGFYLPGLRIAGDCNVNLSPELIREFELPYLEQIAAAFGSLMIHYCGTASLPGHQVADALAGCGFIAAVHTQLAPFFEQDEEKLARLPFKVVSIWDVADLEAFIARNLRKIRKIGRLGFFVQVGSAAEGRALLQRWPRLVAELNR